MKGSRKRAERRIRKRVEKKGVKKRSKRGNIRCEKREGYEMISEPNQNSWLRHSRHLVKEGTDGGEETRRVQRSKKKRE